MNELIEDFKAAKLKSTEALSKDIKITVSRFRDTLGTKPLDKSKKAYCTMKYEMLLHLLEKRSDKTEKIITLYP